MGNDFFPAIAAENNQIALVEGDQPLSYSELNQRINELASGLLGDERDLREERVALFIPASFDYVIAMQAVWRAGGIAVPLNVASAVNELEHYLSSAAVNRLIVNKPQQSQALLDLCATLRITCVTVEALSTTSLSPLPVIDPARRAMMLFTSGTTNKPKGVVHTHHSLRAQIICLLDAWVWRSDDVIPLFLPLHHVHGIVNILCCALWIGAKVVLFAGFDLPAIATQVTNRTYSVFMAVPTIYVKLIQYFEGLEQDKVQAICDGFAAMRLNISGSAACPVTLFNQWHDLTGQVLLERYGMTEIGMGLSNPYNGERRAGYVGLPLPGVDVRLVDENNQTVTEESTPGEIRIKSDNLFLEYWNNPSATEESFIDGWFCTGDMAVIEAGYYRIMGRSSIDIIKSGGYKLSALEIEGALLNHPAIAEVAVIGVEDDVWGEAVAAVVVLHNKDNKKKNKLDVNQLKNWCDGKISAYKIPKRLLVVESLPRNAMGKVTKPQLKTLF